MPGMLEPNAPETQDPQPAAAPEDAAPEPEAPPAETISAATNLAVLAAQLATRDPEEAGRLLRTAAKLIDPRPTFWQTFARDLVDALPTFMPTVERIMAMYVEREQGSVISGCWGTPMTSRRPLRPMAVEPWPPMAGRVMNTPGPSIDETLRNSTGLSQRQYERFKERLRAAGYTDDGVMEITGHLFGIADDPPFRGFPDGVGPAVP